MLQYIINASAIWLLSLVVFDIFLSRENYHGYNRAYLLFTFMLGLVLPLWSWQDTSVQYATAIGKPMAESAAAIRNGITESKAATTIVDMQLILLFIYATGVAVCIVLLLKELLELISTYKRGDKFKDGVWTVVETGKQHSPYSAFRYVFISSKNDYTPDQLRIILTHEEQHGHLLHFFDLLFMQIVKIACWFHPLVYMYAERLSIVHEFQADAAVDKAPKEYGQFLIEQSILRSAPSLSHSFNRSPIKKRITMLTHQSSAFSKSKTLIALPLVLICVLCFTKNAFSDDKKVKDGNKITYRGNVIEMSEKGADDTAVILNPSTGKESIVIASRDPWPLKLNGRKIYTDEDFMSRGNKFGGNTNTSSGFTGKGIKEYVLVSLKEELKQLKNGSYILELNNVIIDEKGAIAYFDYAGVIARGNANDDALKPTKDQQDMFAKKVSVLLNNAPTHIPATINGESVPSIVSNTEFYNSFVIKDGKLSAL